MDDRTKKKLYVAGGIALGALALVGIVHAMSSSSGGVSDSDIEKVVSAALTIETDPAVIDQLAQAMDVLPDSNPLRQKIPLLEARSAALRGVQQPISETLQHIRQF